MQYNNQRGFSLIELLIVVVIIGIVAALAVPALQRGIVAAENRNVHATLRTMKSTQVMFYSQNKRFASLSELNSLGSFGQMAGPNQLSRNKFTFEMNPVAPTEAELRTGYSIAASRDALGMTWRFELTNEGITRVFPGPEEWEF